ncbi:uncharacterized protein LOC117585918 [Drosophila guanche]|uniref:CHK kinase-like domain-containing protein n=1 Tax=Drosophila guanche TaxID=7266 RepID=A0A3B0JQ34_DROGU|nr:uncharacterized protein LOC117585918 [Drosophila guanche]SPP84314.1 Hypothetical predicted protein [Drosophila guanche]
MPSEIKNPNEHLDIPKWVTEEYFVQILQKDEPEYAKILSFQPVAAIPPGENFTSIMLRIHLTLQLKDGSTKPKTYIFKTMLAEDRGGKEIRECGIFDKELQMYQKFLPAFEALYKTAGEDISLAPKCLYAEQRGESINFVFEDLAVKKFNNVDRIRGLDLPHMQRALHKLAEFHAAASVYVEQEGPLPAEFNEGFITEKNLPLQEQGWAVKSEAFLKAISSWGLEDQEQYAKRFPTAKQYGKVCANNLTVDPLDFNTLTHGDFWSSNLMSNYLENSQIEELIMVDFLLCKWGSPAQDLLFFITLSAANDIKLKEFDYFIKIYWEIPDTKYQKPLPTLRDLQTSLYKKHNSLYAVMAVFNHLSIIKFPTDKDSNLHNVMREDEEGHKFRLRLFTNPSYGEAMKDPYPFFYNRGIFNFNDF